MGRTRPLTLGAVASLAVALAACADTAPRRSDPPQQASTSRTTTPTSSGTPTSQSATPEPDPAEAVEPAAPEPRRSFVTIPALGLRDFPVVRYRGSPDDGPGTAIQNAGDMASPRGPRGGVGPGEVGNFIVTGHRLTGTAPLRYSPSLARGDRIRVRSGDTVHVYEVRRTRWTSFREPASLTAQRGGARSAGPGGNQADDHAVDVRDARGPRGGQLLVRRVRQPRAPHRQDRRAGRDPTHPPIVRIEWLATQPRPRAT